VTKSYANLKEPEPSNNMYASNLTNITAVAQNQNYNEANTAAQAYQEGENTYNAQTDQT